MTSPVSNKVEQASEHFGVEWSPEQIAFSHAKFSKRLVRRMQMRSAAMGATGTALVVIAGWGVHTLLQEPPTPAATPALVKSVPAAAPSRAQSPRPMKLADGTLIRPRDAHSVVVVETVRDKEVAVRLEAGGAQFDVTPNRARTFLVRVDSLVVRVLGTSFSVDREPGSVRVEVSRGRVRVEWSGGTSELGADERGVFPTRIAQDEPAVQRRVPKRRALSRRKRPTKAAQSDAATNTWQELARRGQHDAAYVALREERRPVRNDAGDLLLAADAARLSGHPEEAVRYLQRIVDHHLGDERRPLAAFTLGGMVLRQLNDPLRAAKLFLLVQEIAPIGTLASDALAREVEARARAGESDRAKELAKQYLLLYPEGTRRRSVRRFGRLE